MFPNIFFGKPNISKFKFVTLFLLVSCFFFFFARELRSKLGFSSFCGLSLQAQTLNRQPAVTYDMGNREEAIDNKEP